MTARADLRPLLDAPIPLASNTYLHFYNGGKLRAEFMGEADPRDDFRSEEWIFSTNRAITPGRSNPPDTGLSRALLPSGETVALPELLEAFPEETLGRAHYQKYGPTIGILVKIFDVGDGAHIPVHWHPSPAFSRKHLNSPYGKNEAWIVIGTRPGARAWVGWKRDVSRDEFRHWMEAQDVETIRRHMHEVRPEVGDVIFLRDSIVHSLGTGLCILEPQEPTDWNILAEWEGFPYQREEGTLGLSWDVALEAADFSAMSLDYLNGYVRRVPEVVRQEDGSREEHLVPEEAREYFFVSRLKVGSRIRMPRDRGFYCMVTTGGEGTLKGSFGEVPIRRGRALFIPAALPGYEVVSAGKGSLEIVCCYPPGAPR